MEQVRKLEKHQLPLIQNLANVIWPQVYDYMISKEQIAYMLNWMYALPKLEQQWEEGLAFYVLEVDGNPAGFWSTELKTSELFLHKLYLKPEYHGRGLGRFMLNEVVNEARDNDLPLIRLTVNRGNTSVKVYQSFGFQIETEADFEIGNGYVMNDFIMTFRW